MGRGEPGNGACVPVCGEVDMATNVLKVDGVKLLNQVTLTVKVQRATEMRWRIRLGVWLLALLGQVWGCNIEVVAMDGDKRKCQRL